MEETVSEISGAAVNAAEETFLLQTTNFLHWLKGFLTWENLFKLIGAVIILLIMWVIYRLILRGIKKVPAEKTALAFTMSACVIPYLPGDLLKIIVAIPVALKVRPILAQYLFESKPKSDIVTLESKDEKAIENK